jgi:hypothetical protein
LRILQIISPRETADGGSECAMDVVEASRRIQQLEFRYHELLRASRAEHSGRAADCIPSDPENLEASDGPIAQMRLQMRALLQEIEQIELQLID